MQKSSSGDWLPCIGSSIWLMLIKVGMVVVEMVMAMLIKVGMLVVENVMVIKVWVVETKKRMELSD